MEGQRRVMTFLWRVPGFIKWMRDIVHISAGMSVTLYEEFEAENEDMKIIL